MKARIELCEHLIEQNHGGVKLHVGPMLGSQRLKTTAVTIAGIELLHRMRKGQSNLHRLRRNGEGAPAIRNAVLES